MSTTFVFISLLLSSLTAKAEYAPTALHTMIFGAEKIVYGKIIAVDSTHFTLSIQGGLINEIGNIRVMKFRDWTCAERWAEYKVGAELFMFLTKWEEDWYSMGAANEGELPILENSVYINTESLMYVDKYHDDYTKIEFTFPSAEHIIDGDAYSGTKMNLSEFIKNIKYLKQCFKYKDLGYFEEGKWELICEKADIEKEAKSSKLINAILRESRRPITRW